MQRRMAKRIVEWYWLLKTKKIWLTKGRTTLVLTKNTDIDVILGSLSRTAPDWLRLFLPHDTGNQPVSHPSQVPLARAICAGRFAKIGLSILLFVAASCAGANASFASSRETVRASGSDSLALLIPDDLAETDPRVQLWLDASREEGFHLRVVRDKLFISLGANRRQFSGIILPDQSHKKASDELIRATQEYAAQGGHVMLVYDAGTLTPYNVYSMPKSRFSGLAGIDYALYEHLRDNTIVRGPVTGAARVLWALGIPPGKAMPFIENAAATYQTPPATALNSRRISNGIEAISGYTYGILQYPSFVTQGLFKGKVLLKSRNDSVVAGINAVGAGQVLFVNLPLGYLKAQTDGMLLHAFLNYFAERMIGLPRLVSVPEGRGGLVLNWHVDSLAALGPIKQLDDLKVWDSGPFSIHVTAGPDAIIPGDKLGLDVPQNPLTRKWIRYFAAKGHQLGSHGGWIHDYFGMLVNETNETDFAPYVVKNTTAMAEASGQTITEYSPPVGNNPRWLLDWLERNKFLAYYSTSHTGMGPTQAYRDGINTNPGLWAFPITPFGKWATLEEFSQAGVTPEEISRWLADLLDFVVEHRTSRLFYFHPPGAARYPQQVTSLLELAKQRTARGFSWYTMKDLAKFNNERLRVAWKTTRINPNVTQFEASHAGGLQQQTWVLPKIRYLKPTVSSGAARIAETQESWLVIALHGSSLAFTAKAPP